MLAAHLGVAEEEKIDNMSFVFFEDVLVEQGHKLTYDAIVNYAGNAFAENSWDMINDNNPFNVGVEAVKKRTTNNVAGFLAGSNIKIGKGRMPKGKKVNTESSKGTGD